MRFGAVSTITFLGAVVFVACLPGSAMKEPTPGGGGNSGGSSGATSSGGVKATGGATASSGGATGEGGSQGTTVVASGGATAGGTTGTGASGGALGGTTQSGGIKAAGGAAGGGGVVGSGGNTTSGGGATGTCTDDLPPNQTPTCSQWVSYNTCSADWFKTYCNKSCGRCGGTPNAGGAGGAASHGGAGSPGGTAGGGGAGGPGGTTGGGGAAAPGTTNSPITGSNGFATRYWDCCKPSCAWTTSAPTCQKDGTTRITDKNAKSGCDSGGSAFECYDLSPWYDSSTNMSYGFAAHNGVNCGTCFMLQFTGDGNSGANAGAAALKGQQMIVQAINIGGIDSTQFDILIPGGGVGAMNGCATQWGSSTDLGVQYGGLLSECKGDPGCMKGKCQSVFGNMPGLLAGCNWFTGWYSSADNPKVIYKQVSCPSQITSKSGLSG